MFGQLGQFRVTFGSLGRLFWKYVPESLFLPGLYLGAPKQVHIASLPVDPAIVSGFAAGNWRKQSIEIVLAQNALLVRSVVLPKAAVSKADVAISVQMRQTMPAAGKGLIWRAALDAMKDQSAEFRVFIIKQSQIDDLIGLFDRARLSVRSICIEKSDTAPLWSKQKDRDAKRRFWLICAISSVLLASLCSVFIKERQVAQLDELAEQTRSRIADLQDTLVAAREEANKAQTAAETLEQDLALFRSQAHRLSMIAALTERLPDTVWISELTVSGDQLSMSGFASGDVSEVVEVLQGLDWARAVQLQGPISFDSFSGQNRFQLRLQTELLKVVQ